MTSASVAGRTSGPVPGPEPVTRPTGSSLQVLAERAWQRTGGSTVVFEGARWTGAQLAERTRRFSQGLRDAGLAPGDRVVVCMANCPEVSISYQGVWRAGGATTPVVFLLSEDELHHILADSEAAFAVTTPEFLPKMTAAATGVSTLRGVIVVGDLPPGPADGGPPLLSFAELESAPEGELVDSDPASMAALLYTGGTTGRAKGVMLSHDALSSAAWAVANSRTPDENREPGVSVLPLPLSHVYGLMVSVIALHARMAGTAVLMRWFTAKDWIRLVEEHRAEISAVVPTMLQMLLAEPLEEHDLSSLTRLASGGAALPPEVATEAKRRLPQLSLGQGYGCTESAALISAQSDGQVRSDSVGKPALGVTVRIERLDGSEAAPGEDGEICVRGPMVMTGYWRAPKETAYALRGGWLHTGDIGHFDADGYLYVVDRIKDVIIRNGFNVYPSDVEDAMLGHPAVASAAAVGRPDTRHGEEVVAFVALRPGAQVTEDELVAHARAKLAATKYPREVRIIDAVPVTSVGKVDRKKLRATLTAG
jgi:long-chain acyl-CoA synthetase